MDGQPGQLCNRMPVIQSDSRLHNRASSLPTFYMLQLATQPGRDLAIPISNWTKLTCSVAQHYRTAAPMYNQQESTSSLYNQTA